MIFYLVTGQHRYTMEQYLSSWGKELAGTVQVVPYSAVPDNHEMRPGTYVFSDVERLNDLQRPFLEDMWERLSRAGGAVRLLNHPTRSLRRRELLSGLHRHGVNRFGVFPVSAPGQPWRYPVFLRHESEHTGNLSPLLHSRAEVREHLFHLIMDGHHPRELLVVEFCDTADGDRIYRKYSAFRIGDRVIPRHVLFSKKWVLKDVDLLSPSQREEVREYCRTNPHEEELRALFDFAGIQYGRIDYALLDEHIQVWEINTNPVVMRAPDRYPEATHPFHQAFADKVKDALLAIDSTPPPSAPRIPMDWASASIWDL